MRKPRVDVGNEMPEVEVLIDGTWYFGDLRMWFPVGEGEWEATVTYSVSAGERRIDRFPARQVRPYVYEAPA